MAANDEHIPTEDYYYILKAGSRNYRGDGQLGGPSSAAGGGGAETGELIRTAFGKRKMHFKVKRGFVYGRNHHISAATRERFDPFNRPIGTVLAHHGKEFQLIPPNNCGIFSSGRGKEPVPHAVVPTPRF